MVDHGDEQVKEELAAILHLVLHGAAALERVSSADNEGKIVCSEFGVAVGCVHVRKPSRCQDGRALNARLQALLPQSQLLQFLEAVFLSLAIHYSVLQDGADWCLNDSFAGAAGNSAIFKTPALAFGIVFKARVVVALVQVFKDGREDLGVFVGEVDALVGT